MKREEVIDHPAEAVGVGRVDRPRRIGFRFIPAVVFGQKLESPISGQPEVAESLDDKFRRVATPGALNRFGRRVAKPLARAFDRPRRVEFAARRRALARPNAGRPRGRRAAKGEQRGGGPRDRML